MKSLNSAAAKMGERITEIVDKNGVTTSWKAPHEMWPFIEQLQSKGISLNQACWLVRNWLYAGWIPPSIVAEETEKQISSLQEDMVVFKKTMTDMQDWYSKLDDFLKERANIKKD